MKQGFTVTTVDLITAGLDAEGVRLPASAHVAAVRLGLKPVHRAGSYVPSRVDRMVQANIVSTLRTLAERDTSLQRLTETGSLAASHPKVRAGIATKLGRQVTKHLKNHPRRKPKSLRLPTLQDSPTPGHRLILGAVDKQFATMEPDRTGTLLILSLRLPTVARPTSRKHWVSTEIILPILKHLRARDLSKWHLPTITLHPRWGPSLRV